MENNKNELSGTINMLYYLKKFGHFTPLPHLSIMATFLCPQGDRCGEVQLFFVVCDLFLHLGNLVDVTNELFLLPYFLSVLPMIRCAPNYANFYKSVQNDVFLGKNLIVGIFIILFFSVDSSTCSAEDGQQGPSNVWSTHCERNRVGGI